MSDKCPKGKLLNPKTGRCVNRDGKIGQELLGKGGPKPKEVKPKEVKPKEVKPKDCPSHQVRNPKTGRCVNKDGKIGQELLGKGGGAKPKEDKPKEVKPKEVKPKDCPSHQIRNPKTGRCVNKAGKIGQEILLKNGKVAKPVGPGVPDNFVNLPDDCEINKVWKQKDELGRGQFGVAYIACKSDDDCDYVLKVQELNDDFYTEVRCLEDFKNTKGIVPKLYAAWTCDNRGYFVIEKLDKCPADKLVNSEKNYEEVSKLLKRMKEKGWLHVDTHPGNVMCKDGKMIMIDFGWAVKKGKKNYPDHPLSRRLGQPMNWQALEIAQELNAEKFFGVDDQRYNRLEEEWRMIRSP
jgi:hypothetical protein